MISKTIKTSLQLIVVVLLALCMAVMVSCAFNAATEAGFRVDLPELGFIDAFGENPKNISDDEVVVFLFNFVVGVENGINNLENNINSIMSNNGEMIIVMFVFIFWLFTVLAIHSSEVKQHTLMSYYTLGIGNRLADKAISFPKPWWFWGICLLTFFLPIIVPLLVRFILRIIALVLHLILAPFAYIILSFVSAVNAND